MTMNRDDLQRLPAIRIREAQILLDAGSYPGAFYLAGYAVECALKACIAKQTNRFDFPDRELVNSSYTHKLDKLLKVAGLEAALERDQRARGTLENYWDYVKTWDETSRYDASIAERAARDLVLAISDPADGVLEWLKNRW
jgi:HEPN domain-containing protein